MQYGSAIKCQIWGEKEGGLEVIMHTLAVVLSTTPISVRCVVVGAFLDLAEPRLCFALLWSSLKIPSYACFGCSSSKSEEFNRANLSPPIRHTQTKREPYQSMALQSCTCETRRLRSLFFCLFEKKTDWSAVKRRQTELNLKLSCEMRRDRNESIKSTT